MCMQGSLFQAGCYWQILSVNNSHAYTCFCFPPKLKEKGGNLEGEGEGVSSDLKIFVTEKQGTLS